MIRLNIYADHRIKFVRKRRDHVKMEVVIIDTRNYRTSEDDLLFLFVQKTEIRDYQIAADAGKSFMIRVIRQFYIVKEQIDERRNIFDNFGRRVPARLDRGIETLFFRGFENRF